MDRRRFLASAAMAAVAGCSTSEIEDLGGPEDDPSAGSSPDNGGGGPAPDGTPTTDGSSTPSNSDDTRRTVPRGSGRTEPTKEPESTRGTETTIQSGGYVTPTSAAEAFYGALVDHNIEEARATVHPEHPEVPSFPITLERHAPPEGSVITSVVEDEQVDDIVSVIVNMEQPNGRPMSELIAVRAYEDGWLVWRTHNCLNVTC